MKRAPARGMTLLEVMVALAILLVGAAGALSTAIYSGASLGTGQHIEQASGLAQSLLTALMAVPATAHGVGAASAAPNTLFTNTYTTNDGDIADSGQVFAQTTLPASAYDHAESEIAGTAFGALVAPLPASPAYSNYQRYWNIAPVAIGSVNGVSIAVVVRWSEGTVWRRTVVVGTRYFP